MTRTTKEFKTSRGTAIVSKDYITGREFNQIQKCYFDGAKMNFQDGEAVIDEFDSDISIKATETMVEVLVMSVNGVKEGVKDLVLDLEKSEYDEVIEFLDSIANKKKL